MTYYRKFYEIVKCPICDGQGVLNKPFWVSGDQETWVIIKFNIFVIVVMGRKLLNNN